MKNLLFFSLMLAGLMTVSCSSDAGDGKTDSSLVHVDSNADGSSTGKLPVISFDEKEHDFGKLTQGEKVKWSFSFTNTGNSSLVISNVTTTCGCTVADYPKDPIAPGGKGKIDVVFNSESKSGEVIRKIMVVSNCEPNSTELSIKSMVIVPESKYSNETH